MFLMDNSFNIYVKKYIIMVFIIEFYICTLFLLSFFSFFLCVRACVCVETVLETVGSSSGDFSVLRLNWKT
jgi:hypothetical protein